MIPLLSIREFLELLMRQLDISAQEISSKYPGTTTVLGAHTIYPVEESYQ